MNDLTQARKLIKECQETQNPYLDLGNCGISDLKELPELFECNHLETLMLSNSCWDTEGRSIDSHNKGKKNKIFLIPKEISNLRKLTRLIFVGDSVSSFYICDIRFLENLPGLQTLELNCNRFSDYSVLGKLTGLKSLELSINDISDIRFLENLTELKSLKLSSNNISDISVLEKLTGLQSLDLGYNRKISDYSVLENLTELKSLKLGDNIISNYSFLEKLTGLQSLNLGSNKISNIHFLENLTELKSLDLAINEISSIRVLGKLTKLQSLNLAVNKISSIRVLGKLTELQTLELHFNKISDISVLASLTKLQSLSLSSNKISDYSFLGKLTGLQELTLGGNKITDIHFLEKLTRLQSLTLFDNQISDISVLANLSELQYLKLQNNKISDISVLGNLSRLQYLDLRKNKIKGIPLSVFQLKMEINMNDEIGGSGLRLYANPIEAPPLEIIKQGRQSVLDWFEATREKLNEIKIIFIGEPKAGKTSLLRRLEDNSFNKNEVQTDGVNITDIKFGECETFKKQKSIHNVTGHFWDFGGQEIMNATHQLFLTKRSIYVLVLDAREADTKQIKIWLQRVQTTGGNSPIIVLANQIDVNPGFGFVNQHELQKEFPHIKDQCFIKVSCKEDVNIDNFKDKLADLIPTAELFNTEIDERWIKLKEKLQEGLTSKKHFLNERRFKEICKEINISEQGQKNAISFFHDLGLLLHFANINSKLLADYYVLDPYWITYGTYRILTSIHASKEKGIVGMDMLEDIVNKEEKKLKTYETKKEKIEYTSIECSFLIKILHEFKLCFMSPDEKYFIIPDLLNEKMPKEINFPDEKIEFVYQYDYLPKSVIPNFMVEMHRMITNIKENTWRTGCVLHWDNCQALISEYDNKISVIVTGEHKKKREFMSIIRDKIDSINDKLSRKPQRLIPLPKIGKEANYEELLAREISGEKIYTIYNENDKKIEKFEISGLLEGVPSDDEVLQILKSIKSDTEKIEKIQEAIEEITAEQTAEIVKEIMNWITTATVELNNDLTEKLEEIKKTDNVQMKLKLSIPFIKQLGIDFETEFDVKNWLQGMYKKHELKMFKLMGYL